MLLFQIFVAIVRLFVSALLALILFPMWILVVVVTSPLRIFSVRAHQWIGDKFFSLALPVVFLRGKNS